MTRGQKIVAHLVITFGIGAVVGYFFKWGGNEWALYLGMCYSLTLFEEVKED